jgi:3-hydroxyacyl-CoA dehydrogenase
MLLKTEFRGATAVVWFNNPPVNALSSAMRVAIFNQLSALDSRKDVAAIVVAGTGRCFCGGADIREFDRPARHEEPPVPSVIDAIERSNKPVIAAIHGVALGGGCELALGCHYRIAAADARLGLPEIKLGLMPGAGGTQRLPRLVGLEAALQMILSGDAVSAARAFDLGLVDQVVEADLIGAAVAYAESRAACGEAPRRSSSLDVPPSKDVDSVIEAASARFVARARGLIAPDHCLESIKNSLSMSFESALARERELFIKCRESEQSKAQRHLFFAEREAAKVPGISKETAVTEVRRVAVVGCGTMGVGIAVCFADAGIPVTVHDTSIAALDHGFERMRAIYQTAVAKNRLSKREMEARLSRIGRAKDLEALADSDIVIEAIVEEMDAKRALFQSLDALCKPEAILATNTSSLDVDAIASVTKRPDRVIGTHFFSPAHVMKLMENVRAGSTSLETIACVMGLSKTLNKVGVLVAVCDGFVGNRMYHNYTRQAALLLEEGALPQQVDQVIYDFGFPMGPFEVGDLAGLDVSWRIRKRRAATRPSGERYSPIADRLCERGRFGQKSGAGWYRYQTGSRRPDPDPAVEALIVARSEEMGLERRTIDDKEIIERCVYVLINEGARILEEGVASRPGDIDVIWRYGYGFPVHRGGPMFYADRIGLKKIRDGLLRFYQRDGDAALEPAPVIEELVKKNAGFYSS